MKIFIFLLLIIMSGCHIYKISTPNRHLIENNSWLYCLVEAEDKRFKYIDFISSYLGMQCDTANIKNHIDKICCKTNLLWEFEKYALSTKRLKVLDSLLITHHNIIKTDTIKLFECYEDEGTYDILVWGNDESRFVHFTNDTTTIVYKKEITLEEKRINLARDYFDESPNVDTVNLNKNFYDWIKISKNYPCAAVYTPSNLYYYTIFVRDKKTRKYNCIEAILFEN